MGNRASTGERRRARHVRCMVVHGEGQPSRGTTARFTKRTSCPCGRFSGVLKPKNCLVSWVLTYTLYLTRDKDNSSKARRIQLLVADSILVKPGRWVS